MYAGRSFSKHRIHGHAKPGPLCDRGLSDNQSVRTSILCMVSTAQLCNKVYNPFVREACARVHASRASEGASTAFRRALRTSSSVTHSA